MMTQQTDLDQNQPESEAPTWHCERHSDGGALLYTLRQDGWRKGEPVMVNDMMIRIEKDNRSTTDLTPVIDKILATLNG